MPLARPISEVIPSIVIRFVTVISNLSTLQFIYIPDVSAIMSYIDTMKSGQYQGSYKWDTTPEKVSKFTKIPENEDEH